MIIETDTMRLQIIHPLHIETFKEQARLRYTHYKMFGTQVMNEKREPTDPCMGDSGRARFSVNKVFLLDMVGLSAGIPIYLHLHKHFGHKKNISQLK